MPHWNAKMIEGVITMQRTTLLPLVLFALSAAALC